MNNEENHQRETTSEAEDHSYKCDIKIFNMQQGNSCKTDQKGESESNGWYILSRVGMVIYIIAIFGGIYKGSSTLILMGSVFSFSYSLLTSSCCEHFSKKFYEWTRITLPYRGFLASTSFTLGVIAFLLECGFKVFSKISQALFCQLDTFSSLLMGVSLLVLFLDSSQNTSNLSDMDHEKIYHIEITKVTHKIIAEDSSKEN